MTLSEWLAVTFNEKKREFEEDITDMGRTTKKVEVVGEPLALLNEWYLLKPQLDALQAKEHSLRTAIVTALFNNEKLEGTETVDIGHGWKLKAVKDLNISATNASGQTEQMLNAIGQIDPAIASGLVKWKPDISTTVYRDACTLAEANPALKTVMAAAITVKPGMPQLQMIPPKPAVVVESIPAPETGTLTTDGSNVKW